MRFLLSLFLMFTIPAFGKTVKPQSIKELRDATVMIYNLDMDRGGTGSIFRSYSNASHILTNEHVCDLTVNGGYVVKDGRRYLVTHYKKFALHDLCLVRIAKGFGISLEVAPSLEKVPNVVYVSGHPNLLPHIVTKGHLTDRMEIDLLKEVRPCTKEDMVENARECFFFGGIPIIETVDSQVISNLIKPGNSGSAVFNTKGEVIGLVFAGAGRDFSYGFIVPQIYLYYFLQNAHRQPWHKVGDNTNTAALDKKFDSYEKCSNFTLIRDTKIKNICKRIKSSMIWRK